MTYFRKAELFAPKQAQMQPRNQESLLVKDQKPVFPANIIRTPQQPMASAAGLKSAHKPLLDLSTAQFSSNIGSLAVKEDKFGNIVMYEDRIWTRIKSPDREDWRSLLNIKVETKAAGSHKEPMLVIEITDEKDPFFLYTMECGESDYLTIKNEQNLIMDYQQFPGMIIELLERSCSAKKENMTSIEDAPDNKFTCVLAIGYTAEASLSVVETNQFKQLTHLSLKLRNGNDETLKQHLAKKLQSFKAECEALSQRLENAENTLNLQASANEKLKAELKQERDENRKLADAMRNEGQKQQNDMKEQMLAELEECNNKHNEDKETTRVMYETQIAEQMAKIDELKGLNGELCDKKMKLEASERELMAKVQRLEHSLQLQENELTLLRGTNKGLDTTKYTQEKELIELKVRCETMERQMLDREELVKKTGGLYDASRSQCAQMEETINILKANAAKMEEKLKIGVQEINKGNEIIKQLQTDLKASKQKSKLKEGVVTQQEQLIEQNKKSVDDLSRTINDLRRDLGYKEEELKLGKGKIEEMVKKFEETQKVIASNEQG